MSEVRDVGASDEVRQILEPHLLEEPEGQKNAGGQMEGSPERSEEKYEEIEESDLGPEESLLRLF